MANYVLNKLEIDLLELEILENANISDLIPIHSVNDLENSVYHLMYQTDPSLMSLRQLLKMKYYSLDKILYFLQSLEKTQENLKMYLLRPNQIRFDMDYIFYNDVTNKYIFQYLPKIHESQNNTERYVVQDLMIYIEAYPLLSHTMESDYQLSKMIQALQVYSESAVKRCHIKLWEGIKNRLKPRNIFKKPFTDKRADENSQQIYKRTGTMALTLKGSLIEKENHHNVYPLPFKNNTIGRGSHCNVYIPSSTLSTEHAVIEVNQGQYLLKDLSSKNGTYVDEDKIENSKILTSGNIIKFGEKEFIFIL